MNIPYNLQFGKLCNNLGLGELIGGPAVLSGGLLHKMSEIQTTLGKYAVKALNPQVMQRPEAMKNYINSERIAREAAKKVPALPAKVFWEQAVQEVDGQYYLVYDWVDGKSLQQSEIKPFHCRRIGALLADLHGMDFSCLNLCGEEQAEEVPVDWDAYLKQGIQVKAVWAQMLSLVLNELHNWNATMASTAGLLPADIISHRDMDSKNVLWKDGEALVIDWEAAGYTNQSQDLLETALYWSKKEDGSLDTGKLNLFVEAYREKRPDFRADWDTALKRGCAGSIGWLEYNLKRSLGIESANKEEQDLGTEQVAVAISELRKYEAIKRSVLAAVYLN